MKKIEKTGSNISSYFFILFYSILDIYLKKVYLTDSDAKP